MLQFLRRLFFDQFGWTAENNITGITEIDAAIPEYWAPGVIVDGDRESFWGSLTGKEGSMMPVISKAGELKKNGDQVTFNTIQQLMGSGRTGESVLTGYEEKLGIGSFTVSADIVRHAVAVSRKSTLQGNFDEVQMAKKLLSSWFGRKEDADAFTAILSSSSVETLYANSKTAVGSLNSTDGDRFGVGDLQLLEMALKRQGALPLQMKKVNGRSVPIYGCVFGEIEKYWLYNNTTFAQTVREIWERTSGKDHPLLQGAVGIYGNMILYDYSSILPIPQGTSLRPETTIYATLTTTATTLSVGGASETGPGSEDVTPNYTQFFSTTGSLQIENEILSYTAKGNNYFTVSRGASSTTAAQHVPNKLVTERNVSKVIGFGAEALFKAMPQDVRPIGENKDYGAHIGLGIEAYYGQAVKVDKRRGKASNVVVMKVYSDNPGGV
jgi:N4-gp56 family major capsid protein